MHVMLMFKFRIAPVGLKRTFPEGLKIGECNLLVTPPGLCISHQEIKISFFKLLSYFFR